MLLSPSRLLSQLRRRPAFKPVIRPDRQIRNDVSVPLEADLDVPDDLLLVSVEGKAAALSRIRPPSGSRFRRGEAECADDAAGADDDCGQPSRARGSVPSDLAPKRVGVCLCKIAHALDALGLRGGSRPDGGKRQQRRQGAERIASLSFKTKNKHVPHPLLFRFRGPPSSRRSRRRRPAWIALTAESLEGRRRRSLQACRIILF